MNAGSGGIRTLVRIEAPKEADLRIALAIEEGNAQMYRVVIQTQARTIEQNLLLVKRLQSRSNN